MNKVSVVGWVWVSISLSMILSSAMAIFVDSLVTAEIALALKSREGDPMRLIAFTFGHLRLIALCQIAVATFILYSAIMFLGRKAWARVSLEISSCLIMTITILSGLWWIYFWTEIADEISPIGDAKLLEGFQVFGAILGTLVFVGFLVPIAIMIRTLRGSDIRRECQL